MRSLRRLLSVLLVILMITGSVFSNGIFHTVYAAEDSSPDTVTIVATEDYNYNVKIRTYRAGSQWKLCNEKVSFYLKGCYIVTRSADNIVLKVADDQRGALAVFIAPEAGRKSGRYETSHFSKYINSSLQIKGIDTITLQKSNGIWKMTLGTAENSDPDLYLIDNTKSWNEKLKYKGSGDGLFVLDLENYTLSREGYVFKMNHNFSSSSIFYKLGQKKITFEPEQITFRTYETRLSQASEKKEIIVDRTPPRTIIGSIIRFTGDSDDGDNLAIVTDVDPENHRIYISRYNSISYNTHEAGTWLRCYSDQRSGVVVRNRYPKVYLEPTAWMLSADFFNDLFDHLVSIDKTGLLDDIEMSLDPDHDVIGYSLRDVTYSYDGLNFTGGIVGVFNLEMELNFFGISVVVGPVRIDYGTMANSIMDEILRINTYKKEAFRFYFNPEMFKSYADFPRLSMAPDVFPLTFRLYFDKNFELIGGNIRIKTSLIPGIDGIPLPGGVASITAVGGGYTKPQTFEVSTVFQDGKLDELLGRYFWRADADLILSLDQAYLKMDGKVWLWDKKFGLGSAKATIAWDYYKGKRYKGIEFSGETGIGAKKVELVLDLSFKVKKYKSDGKTKFYAGGGGGARIKAFGYTFTGIEVKADTRKVKCSVKVPVIGTKTIKLYWKDAKCLAKLTAPDYYNAAYALNTYNKGTYLASSNFLMFNTYDMYNEGIASFIMDGGCRIVLVPEAKKIFQTPRMWASASEELSFPGFYMMASASQQTLNLPEACAEAAITINYTGTAENVKVTLPNGEEREVIIVDENTVEEPGKLYAMDYLLDEDTGERQMYIQIKNAAAGDYTVSLDVDNVTDQAIYEIIAVPHIKEDSAIVEINGNMATLEWELEKAVENVKYHLSMQRVDEEGNVLEEYALYENKLLDSSDENEEDVEEIKMYIDDVALTKIGAKVSATVKLPDNLPSGDYRFTIEPVNDEEDLYGRVGITNTFSYTAPDFSNIVAVPTGISVENTGNGIARVQWEYDPAVDYWNVTIKDGANVVGVAALGQTELVPGKNMYTDPLTFKTYVYLNIGVAGNTFATFNLSNLEYNEDYTIQVSAIKDIPYTGGPYYHSGHIDMNNIMADQNGGKLTYVNCASEITGRFIEPTEIKFYVELYDKNKTEPVFSAAAYEENQGEIGYDVEADLETLRNIDMGSLVMRTNALDSIKLLPTEQVKKLGIVIIAPDGDEVINIPALTLSNLTSPDSWLVLLGEMQTTYPGLSMGRIYAKFQNTV